jgi:hypothetical protein
VLFGVLALVVAWGGALALALALAACGDGSNSNQTSSEPTTNNTFTRPVTYTLPDGFRNVTFGCHGTVGVYVTSRGAYKNSGADVASLPSSVAVLADDPNCK